MNETGIIEFVCHGGAGGEATVCLELRTRFPGIGGTVMTEEGVASALRTEFSPGVKSGHRMFLRHAIIKKIEDYFHRKGEYLFSHIPRPLGSISKENGDRQEAYLYEWAFGSEGFPWFYTESDGNKYPIILHDWNKFISCFHTAGIDMTVDISDADDADISKNIIHQHPAPMANGSEMNLLWKRIDFGYRSIRVDFQLLEKFLHERKEDLTAVLRYWRYEMLGLATEYLQKGDKTPERGIGRLETLVADYRRSTLHHLVSRGASLTEFRPAYIEGSEDGQEYLL